MKRRFKVEVRVSHHTLTFPPEPMIEARLGPMGAQVRMELRPTETPLVWRGECEADDTVLEGGMVTVVILNGTIGATVTVKAEVEKWPGSRTWKEIPAWPALPIQHAPQDFNLPL